MFKEFFRRLENVDILCFSQDILLLNDNMRYQEIFRKHIEILKIQSWMVQQKYINI